MPPPAQLVSQGWPPRFRVRSRLGAGSRMGSHTEDLQRMNRAPWGHSINDMTSICRECDTWHHDIVSQRVWHRWNLAPDLECIPNFPLLDLLQKSSYLRIQFDNVSFALCWWRICRCCWRNRKLHSPVYQTGPHSWAKREFANSIYVSVTRTCRILIRRRAQPTKVTLSRTRLAD